MVNGRFIVPADGAAVSNIAYTVKGSNVTKGYVISADDEFSADGNNVYTVNAVNVVKATNQADAQRRCQPDPERLAPLTYTLNTDDLARRDSPAGLAYNTRPAARSPSATTASPVTYTVGGADRHRQPPSDQHLPGDACRFTG